MRALPPEEVSRLSLQVIANLHSVPEFTTANGIFTCLSYNNEVDTWDLVDKLLFAGKRVYVPRVSFGANELHVVRYPCRLEMLRIGLQQPIPEEPRIPTAEINSVIDVALVLGVLFDRERGFRLGYGRGFFDRFLARRSFPAIALTFEQQLVSNLPAERHDVPMDVIVTEKRVYRFRDDHTCFAR